MGWFRRLLERMYLAEFTLEPITRADLDREYKKISAERKTWPDKRMPIRGHRRTHHPDRPYECVVCGSLYILSGTASFCCYDLKTK